MKPIDMILAYADPNGHRHALSVFPCWGVTPEGVCECPKGAACTSPGKHPIPLNGLKAATRDAVQIRHWWSAHPNANLGILTGRANGLLVIDVDNGPEKHGEENLIALEEKLGRLPVTWESLTGGGGRHLFFQYPEGLDVRNSTSKLAPNIDVRSEGGYVIAEPSRHASGRIYAWEAEHMPEDVPLAQLPMSWLNALTGLHTTPPAQQPVPQARFELPDTIPVGQRNDVLFKLAASMRAGGVQEGVALEMLHTVNTERCKPPLPSEEVEMVHRSALRYPQGSPPIFIQGAKDHGTCFIPEDRTEIGVAKKFAEIYKDQLLFVPAFGWCAWNGQVWELGVKEKALLLFQELADNILDEATKIVQQRTGDAQAEALLNFAQKIRTARWESSVLTIAGPNLLAGAEDFDSDPWTLNTPGGLVNLKNGVIRPHDPKAMCSMITSADPTVVQPSDKWEDFLERVTCNDVQLEGYFQMFYGMASVGKIYREGLEIQVGGGANGKSTLNNPVLASLGDYATTIAPEVLMVSRTRDEVRGLACLRGKRLVLSSETEEGQRLSASVVKRLTSTDRVRARELYREEFSFVPSHTLVLCSNHLPKISGIDHGIWRRIHAVPFDAKFDAVGQKPHPNYGDLLLREEGNSILRWVIDGARKFHANGNRMPDAPTRVRLATESYRTGEDWISNFIADRCVEDPSDCVAGSQLYEAYRIWALSNGEYARRSRDFAQALEAAGYEKWRHSSGSYWKGLKLVPSENRSVFQSV
jgi:P4 family phage/plasmid primase-like protien